MLQCTGVHTCYRVLSFNQFLNFGCKWESMRMSEWGLARGQDYMYECKETETADSRKRWRNKCDMCVCLGMYYREHQSSASASGNRTHYYFCVQFQVPNEIFIFFEVLLVRYPRRRQHAHQTSMHCTTSITEIMPLLVAASATATATATRNRRRTPLFLVLSPVVNCPLLFWWHCNDHFLHFHPHPPWCCSHCWHVFHVQ